MKLFRLAAVLLLAAMICILSACERTGTVPTSGVTSDSIDTATTDEPFTDNSANTPTDGDANTVETSDSTANTPETADGTSDAVETADAATSTYETKKVNTTTTPETTAPPVVAVHSHFFKGASCIEAGKCDCGAVSSALGHNFTAATCTAPATCTRCGVTNGSALGHSYAGGRCKNCGDTNGPLKPGEAALFKNKLTDEENAQALAVAREIVAQINAQLPDGSQLERVGMAAQLVSQEYYKGVHVEKGNYYHTAYGVFVKRESSCAGCCRALGLVLSCMGYEWNHVNENLWTHQWVTLTIDGQPAWADGQVGWYGMGYHPLA